MKRISFFITYLTLVVVIGCSSEYPTVGGRVNGLLGTLVLENSYEKLTIAKNGLYVFKNPITPTGIYHVTVETQPHDQQCTVANGAGTSTGENITNVDVTCAASTSPSVFAYVTPTFFAQTIDRFTIDLTTGLFHSTPTTAYSNNTMTFGQMALATVGGVKYAYVTDPNGGVYQCTIRTDGSFSSCLATSTLPLLGTWQNRAIDFATFDAQYAYLLDPGSNVVYQCGVDISGDFTNCQQSPSPYHLATVAPYGITFATSLNGVQHAYIADAGDGVGFGDVLMCSMQNDGSFNTCAQTPSSGVPNWIPYAIAFTDVNGTEYAYVADNGTGIPGHVYQCALNNKGTFASCTQTPADDSSLIDWYPYSISFQTVNDKKYAYVVNSSSGIGNLYRCLVDSHGLLTNCTVTPDVPPTSWQPLGITF